MESESVPENTAVLSRSTQNIVIVAAIIALGIVLGIAIVPPSGNKLDEAQLAANRAILDKLCEVNGAVLGDKQACWEGGFVRSKADGKLFRISGDCVNECPLYTTSISHLRRAKNENPKAFAEIDSIILPNDRGRWEKTAIRYAEQFVYQNK